MFIGSGSDVGATGEGRQAGQDRAEGGLSVLIDFSARCARSK